MRTTIFFSVLTLFLLASTAQAQFDQIFGSQGTPTRGAIIEMNRLEVTIESSGRKKTFPIGEIKKLTLLDDPDELTRGRDAAEAGRYEDAFSELQNVSVGADAREIVKQDIAFYRGFARGKLALQGTGDPAAALNEMKAFVSSNPQSFHYFDAAELVGDLAVAQDDLALAETSYGLLVKEEEAPAEQKMRGAVLVAKAQLAQKKFDEAKENYRKVAEAGYSSPDADRQKLLAKVGVALCQAKTGEAKQAITALNAIIKNNDPRDMELFGRAYNALGACHIAENQTQDALLAYLHTDLMFFGDRDAHAEALYHLAELWSKANQSDRAVKARGTLKQRYAGSRWAGMLQ